MLRILSDDRASKASATQTNADLVTFSLGRNQAEYLQAVILRAYRDQIAEVNHLHIDGELKGNSFCLTVMFDAYQEPMSAKEAEKLLGD